MAKFTSEQRGLVLQDSVPADEGSGIWAQFVDGAFETDDAKVVARLRKVEGVSEVKSKADDKSDDKS